mmetsp:Transcript_17668/g.15584  ORF Transcript_17668/g.15584 Transcript_17668/m.15584 type:complete len:103 (+) Transcript_17668:307-615(+)
MYVSKKELADIWSAIQFQDQTIGQLITENNKLSQRLNDTEIKLEKKVKDVNRNVAGMSNNFENLLPIVKDIRDKYNVMEGNKAKKKSRSPMRSSYTTQKSNK